jgi:hypothetical protein
MRGRGEAVSSTLRTAFDFDLIGARYFLAKEGLEPWYKAHCPEEARTCVLDQRGPTHLIAFIVLLAP